MPPKLEQLLIDRGLLSKERLREAQEESRKANTPLHEVLVSGRYAPEEGVLDALAEQYGIPHVRLKGMRIEDRSVKAVPAKLASHYKIMPVSLAANVLTIAVDNPMEFSAAEDIEANLGYRVERVLASRRDIAEAVRVHYGVGADTVEKILTGQPMEDAGPTAATSHNLETMAEDASVVRLVNELMQQAIEDRTTDIHLEVHADGMVARRRIDGILYDTNVPRDIRLLYPAIVSRIKLMSGLNIVERRLPQDGRSRVNIGRRQYDLRVSVVPALHGEDVVIRILPTTMLFSLERLGLTDSHRSKLEELIRQPHGLIFVTGPTGSGKSTTLYACLSTMNSRDRKIITIEDPIEYELAGITQTQINTKIDLSFARMLRSMLRHDPDIMMVGEVRDRETAEIAIQTAMTGHLVLSTLHTNDAAGGAIRLIDMGIDPYLITSTVLAFIAQRLVRVICEHCKESFQRDGHTLYRGKGCRQCDETGYHGRVAICEMLPLTPAIRQLIQDKASASEVLAAAVGEGMRTLSQDGWDKVYRGVTTADEVMRVTKI